jgi:hypothetical protein
VDEYGITQAQRDSYPAGGTLPTSEWQPGRLAWDHHRIALPAVLPAPTQLRIDVGLYDINTGQRLSPITPNSPAIDAYALGTASVLPAATDDAQPLFINFGGQLALVDYGFDRWLVRAGEPITVTLHWQALTKPAKDYVVFVHLLLPPDAVWAQRDDTPQNGARPTSGWQQGERIEDRYTLDVPAEAPAGLYAVEIGLYDPASGERLKVELSDAGIRLGQVRVVD